MCVSNSIWERYCDRKRTNCVLGLPLCVANKINDAFRRSHQTMKLFADCAGANRPIRYWVVERSGKNARARSLDSSHSQSGINACEVMRKTAAPLAPRRREERELKRR